VTALPALANGYVTFGSFSRMGKLSPDTVGLWSELLAALPGSKMLIGAITSDTEAKTLLGWFAARGIEPQRLQFHVQATIKDYLRLHGQVDICLDPSPFTGATTTCHAMWMGVPTLTLEGRTPAGRLGPAMLRHVGLDDFVASDPRDFVEKGLRRAGNLEALSELRAALRERFRQSPLGRPEDFAADLAEAFRGIWRDWCEPGPSVAPSRPPNLCS
jgi:predicted O-linked N-acetylglucosamine transferase (SPINDLY family)